MQFQQVEIIMKTILCIFVTVQCILLVSSVPTARHKRQLPCTHPLRLSAPQYFTHCDAAPCTYGSWSSWKRVPGQNFSSVSKSLCESGKADTEERFRPTTGSNCNQPVRETRRICLPSREELLIIALGLGGSGNNYDSINPRPAVVPLNVVQVYSFSGLERPTKIPDPPDNIGVVLIMVETGKYAITYPILMMPSTTEAVRAGACRIGYSKLTPQQEEATVAFVNGNDVFISLPTGSGKTVCFAVLPFAFDILLGEQGCIAIVVSPLTALMRDQVNNLSARGLATAYVNADSSNKSMQDGVIEGEYQLVYISPELLMVNLKWREMLRSTIYQTKLKAFIVDEAHCVTKWGEYFRREFSNLGQVRSLIPSTVNIMALTATATKTTRNKIIAILGMLSPKVVSVSPEKSNITYWVRQKSSIEEVFTPLADKLKHKRANMPRVIIFCKRCEECAMLYQFFLSNLEEEFTEPVGAPNLSRFRLVDMYMSATDESVKRTIVESFCKVDSPLRVIICTIAFGMGIDCPDVRQVVHWGVSDDIEMYMQESGRGGRDGKSACALLYYKKSDLDSRRTTQAMIDYCKNTSVCRRSLLLKHFDFNAHSAHGCSCCDVCSNYPSCSDCLCNSFPLL